MGCFRRCFCCRCYASRFLSSNDSYSQTVATIPDTESANREPSRAHARVGSTMVGTEDIETDSSPLQFPLDTGADVVTLLVELLSNQYVFFAGVSKGWRKAWGGLPRSTQAITADTSISQLSWSFDCGLRRSDAVFERIAEHCGLEVMQYACSNRCVLPYMACVKAAARGHVEMIRWALTENCGWRMVLCKAAAVAGSLPILKMARLLGCPWDETTCSKAAHSGHLHILQWARSQGCPWDDQTCLMAAWAGELDALKWARAHGCPWTFSTCYHAAAGGHLEVLQWARANGAEWGKDTTFWAATTGHLELLQWATAQGCPLEPHHTCRKAISNGHLNTVEWIVARGTSLPADAGVLAARHGHLHILKWMQASHYAWDGATVCQEAARGGHLDVLEWARANGCDSERRV